MMMTPKPATEFADKTGLCIHPNWTQMKNMLWQQKVIDMGVKNTRGKLGRHKEDVKLMQPLWDAGIRHCATIVESSGGVLDRTAAKGNLDAITGLWGGAKNIIAIEGPNEFNINHTDGWAPYMRDFIIWLHSEIRSRLAMNDILVAGPSIWKRILEDYKALGNIDPYIDRNTLHWYTNTKPPAGAGDKTLDGGLKNNALLSADRVFVTECGMANVVGPKTQAKYLARLPFELMAREIVERFFIFEAVDTDPSPLWGFMDGGMNRRLHYYTMQRLFTLYKSAPVTPHALDLDVQVPTGSNLKWLAHEKDDGSVLVSLFRNVVSTEADGAPVTITVALGKSMGGTIHLPTFGAEPKSLPAATGFKVPVNDQLVVLQVA